jgi:hypothetical protein
MKVGKDRGLVFNGCRVSVLENKKVTEDGEGCTAFLVCLISLNCLLKNGFMLCVFCHNF